MKIEVPGRSFRYVSENSAMCDTETAFVLTTQNSKYLDDARARHSHTIIDVKELTSLFGLERIKIIGITGTNGKTSTASAIYSMLLDLDYKAAMQGTRGFFMNDEVIEGKTLTTPSVLNTYRHIYQAVTAGCDYFVMEVSSHAIVQKRIEGIPFALKILTNITQDHLDYHKDLQSYIAVKNSFFQDEGLKLINKDEPKAAFVIDNTYTYGIENPASYKIMAYTLNDGISAILQHFNQVGPIHSPLYGFFNLYNITAAVGAVHLLTQRSLEEVCEAVDNFAGVSGRMEVVSQQPAVLVDFAHTPDGMQQVLNSLKEKDLLVVFGAGGDRDRVKRPLMGRIAATLAKRVYVTSDNPRTEDPDAIIADILEGIEDRSTVHVDVNRRASIARALQDQQEGEVVVILGKGDETHQVIYDKKLPFDDREIVRELLAIQ